MFKEEEILCLLKSNKEKVAAFFDDEKGKFSLIVKPSIKLNRSRYVNTYKLSYTEQKYIELLRLNPKVLKLEYSQMDYFVLISKIARRNIKLPEGMVYKPSIGFIDYNCTLNVTSEYN